MQVPARELSVMQFVDGPDFDGAFDPAAVMRMHQAFVRAWEYMKASGEVAESEAESARACLALLVVDLGRDGEENVLRLTNLAIARFRRYQTSTSFKNVRSVFANKTPHMQKPEQKDRDEDAR